MPKKDEKVSIICNKPHHNLRRFDKNQSILNEISGTMYHIETNCPDCVNEWYKKMSGDE